MTYFWAKRSMVVHLPNFCSKMPKILIWTYPKFLFLPVLQTYLFLHTFCYILSTFCTHFCSCFGAIKSIIFPIITKYTYSTLKFFYTHYFFPNRNSFAIPLKSFWPPLSKKYLSILENIFHPLNICSLTNSKYFTG